MTDEELKARAAKAKTSMAKLKIPSGVLPEVWATGTWLGRQLKKEGCSPELRAKICGALGQREALLAKGGDVWELAVKALDDYRHGIWEEDGPELAKKLTREKFGDPPNLGKMMEWLEEQQEYLKGRTK